MVGFDEKRRMPTQINSSSKNTGSSRQKFCLLLWKNYVLYKRHKLSTIAELILPILLSLLLIAVRAATTSRSVDEAIVFNSVDVTKLPVHAAAIISQDHLPVVYSPDVPVVNEVVETVANTFSARIQKFGFSSEKEMESYISKNADIDFLAGVVFENMQGNSFPKNIRYKIRLKTKLRADSNNPTVHAEGWLTQQMYPMFPRPGPRSSNDYGPSPHYYHEGFLSVQHAVAMAITTIVKKSQGSTVNVSDISSVVTNTHVQLFPIPPYTEDEFIVSLQTWLPVIIMLSFLFSSINIIKNLVQEKENKIKESMKMMGLSGLLHWTAWYVKSFVALLIPVIIMTVLLTMPFAKEYSVITLTDPLIVFCFLLIYASASIMFCFAVSVFFSRASSAVTAAGLVYFFSYIPYMYIHPRYILLSWELKIFFCLLPNTAMAFGGQFITMYEGAGVGLQWHNMRKGATPDDNLSMAWVFCMLTIDFVLYLIITWYVDAIYPGDFGVPQVWYFPVSKDYWRGTVSVREMVLAIEENPHVSATKASKNFENEPVTLPAGIQMKNLTKYLLDEKLNLQVFGSKLAVNNVTLNMYQGQITVLLGHNGAGKTTTMSMLTGLITPSKGTAIVHGYDIRRQMSGVRASLGLCPQHDILFPELTVQEHLGFFYKLKGAPTQKRETEVNDMITMLNMTDKRNSQVKKLSAGTKRKLSVGIALIGGSKVVLLDEPTSGMDPAARRETWDMLQVERGGRTILLTTHFMDEADILGDRVAIMANGEVKCCGSPLFLKKFYGTGYHMVVVKNPNCRVAQLTRTIRSVTNKAKLARQNGAELTYILANDNLSLFPNLFELLENRKEVLGIESFGVSMPTMEDVFFIVGEVVHSKHKARLAQFDQRLSEYELFPLNTDPANKATPTDSPVATNFFFADFKNNKGVILILQQLRALFVKRIIHSRRNYGLLFLQLALPLIFVSIALILAKTAPKAENEPPVRLTLQLFPGTIIPFHVSVLDNSTLQSLADYYTSQITETNQLKYVYDSDIPSFLLREAEENPSEIRYKYTIGASFLTSNDSTMITAFYGDEPFHSAPVSMSLVDTAIFRYVMNDKDYSFTVSNHPLPTTMISQVAHKMDLKSRFKSRFTTLVNLQSYQGQATSVGFDVAFNLVFGASLLASSFVIFIIKERQTKAKHLQFVSGINTISFWMSSFIWDYLNFLLPCIGIMLLFVLFNQKEYTDSVMQARFLLVFLVYGWSVIPLMYLLSFMFRESSTGFTNLSIFNAFTGMGTFVASIMLYFPKLKMQKIADIMQWLFLPLPNYSLAWAFFNLYKNYVAYSSCTSQVAINLCLQNISHPCCKDSGDCGAEGCLQYTSNFFDWAVPGIGKPIFFMALTGILACILLFLLEFRVFSTIRRIMKTLFSVSSCDCLYCIILAASLSCKARSSAQASEGNLEIPPEKEVEEEDVAKERNRIENTKLSELTQSDIVIMKHLTKYYGSFLAVDNISIGMPRRECFGLLGTTGAGKTTVFNMLTGDIAISRGEAYLEGYSVIKDIKKVRQKIGYCPQFDALIDQMTGRETLKMFARLRGIPEKHIPQLVNNLAGNLMFKEHIDKQVKNYSGGNKRKLSTAVAMVGSPLIVFLDEPTTGVDPVSRRMLWDGLCKLRDTGCSITLTTHSMEECEALCTRLAIMKQGRFRCLGSPQHLKSKFGCSYTLVAKVQQRIGYEFPTGTNIALLNNLTRLCDFIDKKFPGSELKEIHQGMVYYVITNPKLSLATIFSTMEKIKQEFNIEDYSISQTTLEDVFLNFIKDAPPPASASGSGKQHDGLTLIKSLPELTSKYQINTVTIESDLPDNIAQTIQSLPFLTEIRSDTEFSKGFNTLNLREKNLKLFGLKS